MHVPQPEVKPAKVEVLERVLPEVPEVVTVEEPEIVEKGPPSETAPSIAEVKPFASREVPKKKRVDRAKRKDWFDEDDTAVQIRIGDVNRNGLVLIKFN